VSAQAFVWLHVAVGVLASAVLCFAVLKVRRDLGGRR
jgi:hypothetical protein